MGVWRSTTTPAPSQEREEDLAGVGNIDNSNSKMNTKKNSLNDYSVDLNFISLHLNTLASSGAIIVCLKILLILARFLLCGGCSRLMNQILAITCLPVCCCKEQGQQEPQGPSEARPQEQLQLEPPPAYSQVPDLGPQGSGEPPGGSGGPQSDQDLNEIKTAQQAIIEEMRQLKASLRYSKKLSETTVGSVRGLQSEVADMRSLCCEELAEHSRVLRQQRAVVPPQVGRVYPRIPGQTENDNQTSEYLREFFSNLMGGDQEVPQGFVYNMDSDTSDLSGDSGNQSINLD